MKIVTGAFYLTALLVMLVIFISTALIQIYGSFSWQANYADNIVIWCAYAFFISAGAALIVSRKS